MIQEAIELAVRAHKCQWRKDSVFPYIVHPLEVMRMLERWGIVDHAMWAAAVCHDILEDCPEVPHDVVAETIGPDAWGLVLELTRVVDPRRDVPAQKLAYLESWRAGKSIRSLVIKLADRICNTKDFAIARPDYAKKYWLKAMPMIESLQDRYEEVVAAFGDRVTERIWVSKIHMEICMKSMGDEGSFSSFSI